jgi:hypothetical protein
VEDQVELTRFQEYYKRNSRKIPEDAFEKFKEHYPELKGQEARMEFEKQISELFFKRS